MKPRTSALLLTSLLGLSQCIMPEAVAPVEKLPDATQTGANTAGCRVDDLIWLPGYDYIDFQGARPISARWSKSPATGGHGLSLLLSKSIKGPQVHDRTHVSLFVPDITRPGTFVLDQAANPQFGSTNPAYGGFTFSRAFPNDGPRGSGPPGRDPARYHLPRCVGHVRVLGPPGHDRDQRARHRRPVRLFLLALSSAPTGPAGAQSRA